MFRRRICCVEGAAAAAAAVHRSVRWLSVNHEVRDTLTQHLTALKEESKGQSLDLADMSDASKAATRAFQDAVQRSSLEDAQLKGKMTTLSASVKAYNTRLNNLQNEARSIQTEVDAILKLLWGTDSPQGASFAKPPPSSSAAPAAEAAGASATGSTSSDGFDVEPPIISKILEGEPLPKVEKVEAERVVEDKKPASKEGSTAPKEGEEEIEVETIEIEVEPAEGSGSGAGAAATEQDDPVDSMKITDITKELYERGVNFADCLDARSLRQRYRDVLSGKIRSGYTGGTQSSAGKPYTEPLKPNGPGSESTQPRAPPRPQYQHYQQPPPNTNESGLATDPYPNAERKMVDPMKHVWEIKQEIATEKGVDPASVDLWSGKTKLEDSKRLYDYPSIQNYPIEVRQKGDIPR